jgi:hypothetical protein
MKNILFLFLTVTLISCDPNNKDIFNTEFVKLNATIESNAENINLGDTLKINLKIPDTVVTNSGTQIIQSLQRAQFGMYINAVDTANRRAVDGL